MRIRSRLQLAAVFISLAFRVAGAEFYAAPSGTPQGDGSRLRPWDLATALADNTKTQNVNNVVKPGDKVWLLPGTYGVGTNRYNCDLVGATNNQIIVRQHPSGRAIVSGNIYAGSGDFVTFWGFEITCPNPRFSNYVNRRSGMVLTGHSHKAVNLVLHDTGHPGIGGGGGEVYGCVIWGTGIHQWKDDLEGGDIFDAFTTNNPWTRGSALYLQNDYNKGEYLIKDNISFHNFTYGIKCYAENGKADHFFIDQNTVFNNNGEGIGVEVLYNPITNAVVQNNFEYHCGKSPMGIISSDALAQHYSLIYSNNYLVENSEPGSAALWIKRWQTVKMVGNTIVTVCATNDWFQGNGLDMNTSSSGKFLELYPSTNGPLSYTINSNAYYGGVGRNADWYSFDPVHGTNGIFFHTYQPFIFKILEQSPADGTNGLLSFGYWTNKHGFDRNSTYTTNMPTANVVRLRPNLYEPGRANLTVINWQSNATVDVNISGIGLTNGQHYEVRDVQNYFGTPCVTGTYSSGAPTITIPLTLTNVTAVTVPDDVQWSHTAALFNAFVLLPTTADGLAPPSRFRVLP